MGGMYICNHGIRSREIFESIRVFWDEGDSFETNLCAKKRRKRLNVEK